LVDKARSLIQEIHEAYEELGGQTMPRHTYAIGGPEVHQYADFPRLVWECQGGQIVSAQLAGGNAQSVSTRQEAYLVQIWQKDEEECFNALDRLIVACRHTAYPNNIVLGRYTKPGEGANAKSGFMVQVEIDLRLPVKSPGETEVTIEHIHQQVFQNAELVCDEQQDA
jgi:hypothetical protein